MRRLIVALAVAITSLTGDTARASAGETDSLSIVGGLPGGANGVAAR